MQNKKQGQIITLVYIHNLVTNYEKNNPTDSHMTETASSWGFNVLLDHKSCVQTSASSINKTKGLDILSGVNNVSTDFKDKLFTSEL
jgi:hypothetical protein